MTKINFILLVSLMCTSCNSQLTVCANRNMEELRLWPVNAKLILPPYRIVDSSRIELSTIVSYSIKSSDSSIDIRVIMSSLAHEPIDSNLNSEMKAQKQEVEYGRTVTKLNERFISVDRLSVGFLKYLVVLNQEKFYEGRIFFRRGVVLVEIWLFEKYISDQQRPNSQIDCILQSLQLYGQKDVPGLQ